MTENKEGQNLTDNDIGIVLPKDTKGRIVTIAVLALLLMTVWFMFELSILTFILTFVFYRVQKKIRRKVRHMPVLHRMPRWLIIVLLYLATISVVILLAAYLLPILAKQITAVASIFTNFDVSKVLQWAGPRFAELVENLDITKYINTAGSFLTGVITAVGKLGLDFLMAFALSFILLLEKRKIKAMTQKMESSKLAYVYKHLNTFARSFCNTFGKVMRVQVTIAFLNSVISVIILSILNFPDILALGVMIFVLGLIPVAGVIISLIPLSVIAFNIGGLTKVIEIIIMIIIIHVVEAYVLNPKLMSAKTALPASIVFIVLLVSESYLGGWGLLIGVPVFVFLLNMLDVDYESAIVSKNDKNTPGRRFRNIIKVLEFPRVQQMNDEKDARD